jgi:translocation and assembly module TamB
MVFNEDRLQIQSLTAHTGGGLLNVEGFIAYVHGVYFALTATGSDIRLRYPPGVSAAANANLKFQGTLVSSLLSGDIRITKFSLTQQFDFGVYLSRLTQPPPVPKPNSPLNNLHLDVHVVSAPQIQVALSLAKVSGDADLHIRGTVAAPVVLGRVDINQGQLTFNGTTYQIERGDILFINPIRIEPIIDVQLSARVRDYDVTLMFHGTIDKLSATYRSDPPLPSSDIIALLALGHTRQDELQNLPNQPTLAAPTGSAELASALNAAMSSRVQRLFGYSRIKIDPIGNPEATTTATQASRGPTVTVEQQVSNRVTLTYITNVAQSAQQTIEVVFQVNRNVSLDAIRDQNDVLGFDVKIRQRKR